MTDIKHTREPWNLEECFEDTRQPGGGTTYYFIKGVGNLEVSEANARRIVAAVNACAGIPTEHLEKGIISDLIKWRDFQTVLVRDNVILSQEDQRRAAIAFKAVEGIPTEALEAGVVGELMECLSRLAYEAERRAGVPGKYVANARELLTQASYYERRRKALAKAKGDADANQ
jgi:hypothetical protein